MNCPMTSFCSTMLKTDCSWSALIARLAMGGVMLPHGLQNTLGLFGGGGFTGAMTALTSMMGLSSLVAFLVIIAESVGAFALILGFCTRFCAASLGIVMVGAAWLAHRQHGFFMNWFGQQQGEGFEYHLLAIGLCLSLVVSGGGKWSVDCALNKRMASDASACCT